MHPLVAYFAAYPLQANLYRAAAAAGHPIAELAASVGACAAAGVQLAPLSGAAGDPRDEAWWSAALASADPARRAFGGITLVTADDPSINLRYHVELAGTRPLARLRVDFPASWLARGAELAAWFGSVAEAYAARAGGVHTTDLLELVRDARSESTGELAAGLAPDVRATFAALEPHAALDVLAVPEAVWWINWWPRAIVDAIGAERVLAAPWADLIETSSGARLAIATDEAPDRHHPGALAAVARITSALDLAATQRGARHPIGAGS